MDRLEQGWRLLPIQIKAIVLLQVIGAIWMLFYLQTTNALLLVSLAIPFSGAALGAYLLVQQRSLGRILTLISLALQIPLLWGNGISWEHYLGFTMSAAYHETLTFNFEFGASLYFQTLVNDQTFGVGINFVALWAFFKVLDWSPREIPSESAIVSPDVP